MMKSFARVIASVVVEVLKEWTGKLNMEGRERGGDSFKIWGLYNWKNIVAIF